MEISHSSDSVADFCRKIAKRKTPMLSGEMIHMDNSEMTKAVLGCDFVFVNQEWPVLSLCPDLRLTTLLANLPAVIASAAGRMFPTLEAFREACIPSRTLTREVTRLLCDPAVPLVIRDCPACHDGAVCIK